MNEIKEHVKQVFNNMPNFYAIKLRHKKGYHAHGYFGAFDLTIKPTKNGVHIENVFADGGKFIALVFNERQYNLCISELRNKIYKSINSGVKFNFAL